jgi:hypothetical protein
METFEELCLMISIRGWSWILLEVEFKDSYAWLIFSLNRIFEWSVLWFLHVECFELSVDVASLVDLQSCCDYQRTGVSEEWIPFRYLLYSIYCY